MIDLRTVAELRLPGPWTRRGDLLRGPCPVCLTSSGSEAFQLWRDTYYCHACGTKGGIRTFFADVLHDPLPPRVPDENAEFQAREQKRIDTEIFVIRAGLAKRAWELRREIKASKDESVFDLYEVLEAIESFQRRLDGMTKDEIRNSYLVSGAAGLGPVV